MLITCDRATQEAISSDIQLFSSQFRFEQTLLFPLKNAYNRDYNLLSWSGRKLFSDAFLYGKLLSSKASELVSVLTIENVDQLLAELWSEYIFV